MTETRKGHTSSARPHGKEAPPKTIAGDKSRTTNLPWQAKAAPTRGPKPGHSVAEIGLAAIRIADQDGLEAVTMQRAAREVGLTTMAIYRYFPGKAELMAVMIDSAGNAPPAFGDPSAPWKDRVRVWARRCAAIYRLHPWFLEATTVRRTLMGPNELSWMEAALQMLIEAGLSPKEAYQAFLAVIGHVRAHAMFQQMKSHTPSPRMWIRDLRLLLRSEGAKHSGLQAVLDSGAFTSDPVETFENGLTWILEGIAASRRALNPNGMNSKRSTGMQP